MALMAELKCTVCQADDIPLDREEIAELHCQVPDWDIAEEGGVHKLKRTFKFNGFISALEFTSAIGGLAQAQGHHPTLITMWGSVTIIWWTHKISGLHENDFIMAARTDGLYQEQIALFSG